MNGSSRSLFFFFADESSTPGENASIRYLGPSLLSHTWLTRSGTGLLQTPRIIIVHRTSERHALQHLDSILEEPKRIQAEHKPPRYQTLIWKPNAHSENADRPDRPDAGNQTSNFCFPSIHRPIHPFATVVKMLSIQFSHMTCFRRPPPCAILTDPLPISPEIYCG